MRNQHVKYDVVVIGGGPAGMAAAWSAAQYTDSVAIFENTPWLGGQIWRQRSPRYAPSKCKRWLRRVRESSVQVRTQTTIVGSPESHRLLAENPEGGLEISYKKLILAVGARELFVPFPGWTLSNIFGVGGLHNVAKLGWPVKGKKIAIAGSGPLLFTAAAHLRILGAKIVLIAEQADFLGLVKFGMRLPFLAPDKLVQGGIYQAMLLGVPYKTHCWPIEARGEERLQEVKFTNQKKTWTVPCDYLACAFGLAGNLELPHLIGCRIKRDLVEVNSYQQTSIPEVYCVGEPTGISGIDGALVEGMIAGYSSIGKESLAEKFFSKRDRMQRFAETLLRSFALRPELRNLARGDTLLCRCEDVTLDQVRRDSSWRAAKLYHHMGMGPCQGRTCGGIMRFMFGWEPTSVRPPLFPVKTETLAAFNPDISQPVTESH